MLPIGLMYNFINDELNGEQMAQEIALDPVIRQREARLEALAEKIVTMRERQANDAMEEMAAILAEIDATDPHAAATPQMEILKGKIAKGRYECKQNTDVLEAAQKQLMEKNKQQHERSAELKQLQHTIKNASKDSQLCTFLKQGNDKVCDYIGRSNASRSY